MVLHIFFTLPTRIDSFFIYLQYFVFSSYLIYKYHIFIIFFSYIFLLSYYFSLSRSIGFDFFSIIPFAHFLAFHSSSSSPSFSLAHWRSIRIKSVAWSNRKIDFISFRRSSPRLQGLSRRLGTGWPISLPPVKIRPHCSSKILHEY